MKTRCTGRNRNLARTAFAVSALLFCLCGGLEAQQAKTPRIGVLLSGSRNPVSGEAFKNALQGLGYVEGKTY
jgi:hypothetical protein